MFDRAGGGAGEIVSFVRQACGRRPFVFSIAWRCHHARSKTACSEGYAKYGLSRVGTTPSRSGGCGNGPLWPLLAARNQNLLDTIAGVNSFIRPTAPVAMGGAICMLFDRCVVGRSRTWAYFFDKYIFCKTQNIFAPKKYRVFFFNSNRFRATPGG